MFKVFHSGNMSNIYTLFIFILAPIFDSLIKTFKLMADTCAIYNLTDVYYLASIRFQDLFLFSFSLEALLLLSFIFLEGQLFGREN